MRQPAGLCQAWDESSTLGDSQFRRAAQLSTLGLRSWSLPFPLELAIKSLLLLRPWGQFWASAPPVETVASKPPGNTMRGCLKSLVGSQLPLFTINTKCQVLMLVGSSGKFAVPTTCLPEVFFSDIGQAPCQRLPLLWWWWWCCCCCLLILTEALSALQLCCHQEGFSSEFCWAEWWSSSSSSP